VTNTDIVATQFKIASGESIASMDVQKDGYAMEVRITAERAAIDNNGVLNFIPNPGDIIDYSLPDNNHVKVISMINAGKTVSPYYDSLIMQVIAFGLDREATIKTLTEYLAEVKISGVCTNIPMLIRILKDDVFQKGIYDTNYLEGFIQRTDQEELIKEIEASSGEGQGGIDRSSILIEGSDEIKVLSTQAGVFYTTSSPSEPEFVKEGDEITLAKTLCLLEAMKLFTSLNLQSYNKDHELYADQKYTLVRTVPVSGQAVNKGDLLFVIKPVSE
jgi:acetyl/propionyl-CoA carboxylase alpha subunit